MTTVESRIWDNIKTTLQAINGTGSFFSTVRTVERYMTVPAAISAEQMPWVGIETGGIRTTMLPSSYVKCAWPIKIMGVVYGASENDRYTKIFELQEDIRAALLTDIHRGVDGSGRPNAIATKIVAMTQAEYPSARELGQAVLDVVVEYDLTHARQT